MLHTRNFLNMIDSPVKYKLHTVIRFFLAEGHSVAEIHRCMSNV